MPSSGASAAGSPGLAVREVSFSRVGAAVLERVSFDVPRGRLVAIVGPSGAGKSTLLSLLAGFERPSAGTISFAGTDWSRLSPNERAVGMSFDDAALHEHLTVRANIESAAAARGEPSDRTHDRVKSLLHALGIAHLADRHPASLSAGERRRTAIARVFIRAPQLVLLDEPFANLDRANRFAIRQMVRELQRSTGAAAIVVTHDPTDALAIADDMLVLVRGEVRAFGPATAIADAPPDLEVAQLVDDLGMHVIEIGADGRCEGASISPAFRAEIERRRRSADAGADAGTGMGTGMGTGAGAGAPTLVGMRPWQIRVGPSRGAASDPAPVPASTTAPSIEIEAKLLAREPAGVFTDLIALRPDGRTLRARVRKDDAQELPIGAALRFQVDERDAHLFAGPWPGRRLAR
jgi:ABC-type sugar transport system ATPase subunit